MKIDKIDRLLIFDIKGKAGHFRKFYTNSSSLSYGIPPRTVISGMLGSILKIPRDEYYEMFSIDKSRIGIEILSSFKKHFECMNYKKKNGEPTQVRLELLLPEKEYIKYRVYFYHSDDEIFNKLKYNIKNNNLGYGTYLGQRQFRADLKFHDLLLKNDIEVIKNEIVDLNTLINKSNIVNIEDSANFDFVEVIMPNDMKKVKNGREKLSMNKIGYEKSGNSIKMKCKKVLKLKKYNKHITFYN